MIHTTTAPAGAVRRTIAWTTAVFVTGLLVPAPATAETVTVPDGDDTRILADIQKVRVVHSAARVRVRIAFDDLMKRPKKRSQGISVFIDTDHSDKGPEYHFTGGLNAGTDYVLSRVDNWADDGEHVTGCHQRLRINWRKDFAVATIGRACLGDPSTIRVAVKSGEWRKGKGTRYDWLTGRRAFTGPLASD